ncbi:hypothetical protein [Planctomicrobium sp. SH527]|uniref:hypothetical protein n=1 Tax=Planctomicrobium sp. SH527 TaxID=3448123 RepID=UPI003F5B8527
MFCCSQHGHNRATVVSHPATQIEYIATKAGRSGRPAFCVELISGEGALLMAKQTRPPAPLTQEDQQGIQQYAIVSATPLTAKQIAQQVTTSRKVRDDEIDQLLQEAILAGELHVIPPASAKGKPQYWGQSLDEVATRAFVEVIKQSDAPMTLSEILKKAVVPVKLKEPAALAPLHAAVSTGEIREFAPTSGKGKPRYWDRDPAEQCRPIIVQAVLDSPEPVTAAALIKRLKQLPIAISESEITELLNQLSKGTQEEPGQVFNILPATKAGKPLYWGRDRITWGEQLIRQTLEKKGPQPHAAVLKSANVLTEAEFAELIESKIARGELFLHPPVGKIKKPLLATQPPRPEPYLQPVAQQLQTAIAALRAAQVPEDQLRRALVQIVEGTGISFGTQSTPRPTSHASSVDLEALIRHIEPGAAQGALVGIRDLRRAAGISKPEFDSMLLELSRQGQVSLHRHDYPASLTAEERNDLVVDPHGTYYVGVALRQNRW